MSTTVSVPKDGRIEVAVINGATAAVIKAGCAVILVTATVPNTYKVTNVGATAGTVVRLFGIVENEIATGAVGSCVIHGPAVATAYDVITVKQPLTAIYGTAGIRGRVDLATAASTAGLADNGTYIGWAMGPGSTGASIPIFVTTTHTPCA
jgi:hypothetical protein